jgi:hypothetical protein
MHVLLGSRVAIVKIAEIRKTRKTCSPYILGQAGLKSCKFKKTRFSRFSSNFFLGQWAACKQDKFRPNGGQNLLTLECGPFPKKKKKKKKTKRNISVYSSVLFQPI